MRNVGEAGVLSQAGFYITNDFNSADVCIFNSCTVKAPSQVLSIEKFSFMI